MSPPEAPRRSAAPHFPDGPARPVPVAARVAHRVGAEADRKNYLLMFAMGPNLAGVIGTVIAAGIFLTMLGQ